MPRRRKEMSLSVLLCVDDRPPILQYARDPSKNWGSVLTATNAPEAIALLESWLIDEYVMKSEPLDKVAQVINRAIATISRGRRSPE